MTVTIPNRERPEKTIHSLRGYGQVNIRRVALLVTLMLHGVLICWGMSSGRFGAPAQEKIQAIRVFLPPLELPEMAAPSRPPRNPSPPAARPAAAPAAVARPAEVPLPPSLPPTSQISSIPEVAAVSETLAGSPVEVSVAPLSLAAATPSTAGANGVGNPSSGSSTAVSAGFAPTEAGVSTGASAAVATGGAAGAGRALYKLQLFAHIEAHKYYPPAARRRRLAGQVRVSFTITPGGGVSELTASEGHPQLEEAALRTVRSALPLPLPASGVELPFRLNYRMDFRLR